MLMLFHAIAGMVALFGPLALDQDASQSSATETAPRVIVDAQEITIERGEHPLLRYRYTGVPFKPYVRELYTPSGVNVLRDAPSDHKHHHGLMFGVAVDGEDFWAEERNAGTQTHTNIGVAVAGGAASFSGLVVWTQGPHVLLREHREISVMPPPDGTEVTLVTWWSGLSPDGPRTLGGSHYFGLGMRFGETMDEHASFVNPTGAAGDVFRGDERLVRANWCAITGPIDGKAVTVAMFDDPANPRHPATWFTMGKPFAYLSATLSLHTEPMPVMKGEAPNLVYGIAVWDGRVDAGQIEKTYQYWVSKGRRLVRQGVKNDDQKEERD